MYTIREACPSDNDALIGLEMRCPLYLGEVELVMDRRPDFFGHARPLDAPLRGLPHTGDEFCCFIPAIPVPEEGVIEGMHLDPFYL